MGSRYCSGAFESLLVRLRGDWMLVVLSPIQRERKAKPSITSRPHQGKEIRVNPRLNNPYSDEAAVAVERVFQIRGRVAHDCPRCCGLNPNNTIRPFPTPT